MSTVEGSATVVVDQSVEAVFAAITDVTRMGEWSPETTACRWIDGATGAAVGAKFEGDNVASVGPITLKRWTTVSEVTAFETGQLFEFVAEGYSTWRFEFVADGDKTTVTESFSYPEYSGWQRLVYGVLARRRAAMVSGMKKTLERVKTSLESSG